MAVKLGTFSARSTAGSQSVTGVGFQPVAVLFFTIEANQANPSLSFGAATGSGEEWAMNTSMDDQASTYDRRYRELRDDRCIYVLTSPNFTTEQCAAEMTSLDSDGFTLNFTTGGNAEPIAYVAIGGQNISDAHAGTFTVGDSTGTTGVTGCGFEPNALVVVHVATPVVNEGAAARSDMAWGIGFADMNLNQYSSFAWGVAGGGTSAHHVHRTDAAACFYHGSDLYYTAIDSWDSDGFTVDVIDAFSNDFVHGYLAIRSAANAVGNDVQPDSTGTQTLSAPGFKPGGVIFGWNGADTPSTSGAATGPVRPGVGAMDGEDLGLDDETAQSISMIHRASAPFGAYVPDSYQDAGLAINMRGAGSQLDPTAHVGQGLAAFSAFDQGSFTLNWTTVTSGADRAFGWLALPGSLPIDWIPHIYRRVLAT